MPPLRSCHWSSTGPPSCQLRPRSSVQRKVAAACCTSRCPSSEPVRNNAAIYARLFAAGFLEGGEHELRLGPVNEIPYLINQDRWTFWRCGLTNPLSLEDFRLHQGFKAFEKALVDGADAVIEAVTASGLRGRGGAGRARDQRRHAGGHG